VRTWWTGDPGAACATAATPADEVPPPADEVTTPAAAVSMPSAAALTGDTAVALPDSAEPTDTSLRVGSDSVSAEPLRAAALALLRTAERLDGIADASALTLRRFERALAQFGIEPIACAGRLLDPQTMEAVQTTADPEQPAGTVTAEVRHMVTRNSAATTLTSSWPSPL
jgi:hypothetical protein